MQNFLTRTDALLLIHTYDQRHKQGVTFSITFVKCDRHRQTGGQIVTIQNATLAKLHKQAKKFVKNHQAKHANQWTNKTRNILDLSTNQIIKVHIDLILYLNDLKIIP